MADGVLVRQSAFCLSNAVVVLGGEGALLVDPGVTGADLVELADDLDRLGLRVLAGFATHPHWDHVLWHERFGDVPRYATAACAAYARDGLAHLREQPGADAPGAPLDLVGLLKPLPPHTIRLPWDGPDVRVLEHRAHAPSHAALLVEDAGVLIAGDMLSDVEIPLLDVDAEDPIHDYSASLALLRSVAAQVRVVVPGHGNPGRDVAARLAADRAYLASLTREGPSDDPRLAPDAAYGTDWLPQAHLDHVRMAIRS
ncbi:MBL fold metallo-hydrolase [Luteipulveratus halotolerans]|uniref:MBL fold metallo-hydrolase n=1 Tax=Luteipulveratus halotolerans TaxID=1631356 RepID=UPI001E3FE9E1|nr:MBL fold metallo-hydrolase [Luteipulveratus halotolerans]